MEAIKNSLDGTDFQMESPSIWKRIGISLIDVFLSLIFSFLIFGCVGIPSFFNLPSVVESQRQSTESGINLTKIADSSKLQRATDDTYKSLYSMEQCGKFYLDEVLMRSCKLTGTKYYVKGQCDSFYELDLSDYDAAQPDSLTYYFTVYKADNSIGDYKVGEIDYSSNKLKYLNTEVLKVDSEYSDLLIDGFNIETDQITLNAKASELLVQSLKFDDTNEEPMSVYNRLQNMFQSAAGKGIKDIEANYKPYIDEMSKLETSYSYYSKGYCIMVTLCVSVGYLITYVIFPLCFKKGRTLGMKVLRTRLATSDGDKVGIGHMILRDLILFFTTYWIGFFMPLFVGQAQLTFNPFLGEITMFSLCLFSILLYILSLVTAAFGKGRQTLEDLTSLSFVIYGQDRSLGKEE